MKINQLLESNFRKYEKDEGRSLLALLNQMNELHARMGGRDSRPERLALMRCMRILSKEIEANKLRTLDAPLVSEKHK